METTSTQTNKVDKPSLDNWLKEAKNDERAKECGMFLFHNGVVRKTAKARVREKDDAAKDVAGMYFDYDDEKLKTAIEETYKMPGVYYIKVWLNKGELEVGEDIMLVLVGGDIRPHVVDGLQNLVGEIKTKCVVEKERYE